MMLKKMVFFLLSFISLFSNSLSDSFEDKKSIDEPSKIAMRIMDQTSDVLKEKYNLQPFGFGMNGKFECLSIDYHVFKKINKDEARVMLFDCVELFLNNINSEEKIKPYLKPNPFTEENVGIVLYIRTENNGDLFHPEVSIASYNSGRLIFQTKNRDWKKDGYFKETYEETYEQALELVKKYREEHLATEK